MPHGPSAGCRWPTTPRWGAASLHRYGELGVLLGSISAVNTFDESSMTIQGGPGTATTNLPHYLYERVFQGLDVGQAAVLDVVAVVGTIVVATFAPASGVHRGAGQGGDSTDRAVLTIATWVLGPLFFRPWCVW